MTKATTEVHGQLSDVLNFSLYSYCEPEVAGLVTHSKLNM